MNVNETKEKFRQQMNSFFHEWDEKIGHHTFLDLYLDFLKELAEMGSSSPERGGLEVIELLASKWTSYVPE